jgi:DNA ligase (NAD+)
MDSIVKRASVYNASWMIANKCYPGAEVTLIKSGDIIPVITEITKPSELTYKLMTEWNGKKVSFNDVNLIVEGFEDTNEYKSIQMYHAISSLGFKNIGPATCELLVNTDISLFDLLQQTPDAIRMNLINSKQFKDGRELELLIENLYALNSVEMWQIIYSFGWRNCGKTISKQLANYVCGISYDFKGLEKVVVEGFINSQDKQNKVKEMENILTKNNIKVNKPKSLQGLITYCMTGSPTTHPTKEQYKFDIESSGKCIESSLKSDTMYLVTNSLGSMTGKMLKAEKNGTKILDYQQFLDLIKEL